jgi:hypothetical protein
VRATIPGPYRAEPLRNLKVGNEECTGAALVGEIDGGISGRVVDMSGSPVGGVDIDLKLAGEANIRDAADGHPRTDALGRFEVSRLPPGRYLLGINLIGDFQSDRRYPRTFYPGTQREEEAAYLTVGTNRRVSGVTLRLPIKVLQAPITGTVVWPDGRPIRGASVSIQSGPGMEGFWWTYTDAKGRFTLRGLIGKPHEIRVHVEREREVYLGGPITAVVTRALRPLRIVVKPAAPN